MFDLIPIQWILKKKSIVCYLPQGSMLDQVPQLAAILDDRIGTTVTTLGKDLERNIHVMFDFIPFSGSQEEVVCYVFPIEFYVQLSSLPLAAILDDRSAPK